MHIIELNVENVLRLKAVSIRPDGSLVQITGRNDQGKSSVLNSIWLALKHVMVDAPTPLRDGCERGHIRLKLGEADEVLLVVERVYTKSGTILMVEDPSTKARFKSPQAMLDALIGDLCFDPLEFARMRPADQLDRLRAMVKLDVNIEELDRLNAEDYAQRTVINRDEKSLRAQAVMPEGPDEPVDVDSKLRELDAAEAHNRELLRIEENVLSMESELSTLEARRKAMLEEARAMAAKMAGISNRMGAAAQSLVGKKAIDTRDIKQRISDASATNEIVAQRARARKLSEQASEMKRKSDELTKRMEGRERAKRDAIASAKMPLKGLGFGDKCITLNGVPFQQASSMQKIETCMAIAFAANPKLRVVCIRDGSLLDHESLTRVEQMAAENGMEVWIERVDDSGKIGFVIEDGEVASAAR